MQYAIHHLGTPLFAMLIVTAVLSCLAAIRNRAHRRICLLLAASGVPFMSGGWITGFGKDPPLKMIDTWNIWWPPSNWKEIADRWYVFHTIRITIDVFGFVLIVLSAFLRRTELK